MHRTRKFHKQYPTPAKPRPANDCPFCNPPELEAVEEHAYTWVVRNIFPYQFWEFMRVTNHLMLVPKRHIESLDELTKTERAEYMNLIAAYQKTGHNIYAREKNNPVKSIAHQHTHLIQTTNVRAKIYMYLRRPYFVFRR